MNKMNFTFSLSLFLFLIISSLTYPQLIRKGPYLIFNGNENEMLVLWQTYSSDTCQIDWGIDTLYSLGIIKINLQEESEVKEDLSLKFKQYIIESKYKV